MAGPLSGIRVVDFTQAVAGPVAGVMLGNLGAEVIHVEYSSGLRPIRQAGALPLLPGCDEPPYNRGTIFNECNRGKKSISLNVAHAEGRELFLRLVAVSDIVVENYSPRVLGNLGIDYPELVRHRPDIILASIPAFGLSGPYRDKLSYGPGIDAMSGFSHLTGYADSQPLKPGNYFCDQSSATFCVLAILGALWRRRQSGEGARIEIPMIEAVFQLLGDAYLDYAMNGTERSRQGNAHEWMAPHNVYPCAGTDTWVAIAVGTDAQWRALCGVIERPDLGADPEFAGALGRYRRRQEIDAEIGAWTVSRDHYAIQEQLQASGVPAGAVLDGLELLRDPHVVERGAFEYPYAPGVGPTPFARVPFMAGRPPSGHVAPAPAYGEHNEEVFRDLLAMGADELARLERAQVVLRVPTEYLRAQASEGG